MRDAYRDVKSHLRRKRNAHMDVDLRCSKMRYALEMLGHTMIE